MNHTRTERLRRLRSSYRRAKLHRDEQPADPVVTQLFRDLQLAQDVEQHRRKCKASEVQKFERQAWYYLIEYLLTLESSVY
jgi:hypothetical protein